MIIQRLHQCDGTKEKWFWSDSKGIVQEADFDFNQTQRLCELDSPELTSQIKLVLFKNLLVGDQAGIFKVIDLEQRKVIFSNQVCDSPITSITANHNNSMFAVGSLSGSLKIFKAKNKSYKEFRSVKSDHIPIDSLSFFNDSKNSSYLVKVHLFIFTIWIKAVGELY